MASTDYISEEQLDAVVADINDRVLKLTGGTLLGALLGTTALMSGTVTAREYRATRQNEPTLTSTLHGLQVGDTGLPNMAFGPSRIQARNNGAPASLTLNPNGGDVLINSGVAWHSANFVPAIARATNQTNMAAGVDPDLYPIAITNQKTSPGDLGGGRFLWDTSVGADEFASDPKEGVYVQSTFPGAPTGGWRRDYEGPVYAEWFRGVPARREIADATQFSLDVRLRQRTYLQDETIKVRTGGSLRGTSRGNTVIRFNGGTGPMLTVDDPSAISQNITVENILFDCESPRDWVVDMPDIVNCDFRDIRIVVDDDTTGGFRSHKNLGTPSWNIDMLNVQVRLPDTSTADTFDCEFGDSDLTACVGTGGDGAKFRPTGGLRFIGGRFDRAVTPVTMIKNDNTNSSVSFKGTQFEEFTSAGLRFLVEAGATGTAFAFSLVGGNFRAGGNTPTADIVLENNSTEEMIGGTLNAAHTVGSVLPIAYLGAGTWRDVIFAPEHLTNANWEPTKFAGNHSVFSSRGMRTEGPIIPGAFTTAQLSAANGNASLFPSRSSGGIVIWDNGANGTLAFSFNNRWRTTTGAVI